MTQPRIYLLMISEEQRKGLMELIKHQGKPIGEYCGEGKPLQYWPEMLEGLPDQELDAPGSIHGFCL